MATNARWRRTSPRSLPIIPAVPIAQITPAHPKEKPENSWPKPVGVAHIKTVRRLSTSFVKHEQLS
jgi:hypothetical protein